MNESEQHALAVDHVLDTLIVPAGTGAASPEPEPWAGQEAPRTGPRKASRSGMPKRCFGRSFLSISTHTRNPESQGRPATTPGKSKSMPTVPGVSRSVNGVPAFIDPKSKPGGIGPADE